MLDILIRLCKDYFARYINYAIYVN